MTDRVDVLIAGGGALGSAIAWALARHGIRDVSVVDVDLDRTRAPLLHARPVRATFDQEVNARAAVATLGFFAERPAELGFEASGHVWLYDLVEELARRQAAAPLWRELGLPVEELCGRDLGKLFPVLDRAAEEVWSAHYLPRDGRVDPCRVRAFFRERAASNGVRFLDGHYLLGVSTSEREPGRRRVERADLLELGADARAPADLGEILTAHSLPPGRTARAYSVRPGVLVNALGAWSSLLCARLGAASVAAPWRRTLSVLSLPGSDAGSDERRADPRSSPGPWPSLVVDPSGAFCYPDSAYTMAGLDEVERAPGFDFRYEGERFFQNRVWPHLAQRSNLFERVHHLRGSCLLEAQTPDGSGILGWLPGFSNVLEAYGFPSSGLSHVFALARGLCELVVEGRYETLDLAPLGRERLDLPERWLREGLRI